MKNELIPFVFENHDVRITDKNGEPWFVAKDVCDILALGNAREALRRLDDDEVSTVRITDGTSPLGGNPNVNIVNESGLYKLIFRSRTAKAKEFTKWVTSVVLPQIRKTGSYVPGNAAADPRLVHELNETLNDTKRTLMAFQSENRHLRKENMLHEKIERLTDALGKKGTRVTDAEKEAILLRSGVLPVAQIADLTGRSEKTVRTVIAASRGKGASNAEQGRARKLELFGNSKETKNGKTKTQCQEN